MLSNEQICSIVQAAFLPHRCVAEIWDYSTKLRFRVFDENDHPLLTMEEVILSSVREGNALESLLSDVRQHLGERRK